MKYIFYIIMLMAIAVGVTSCKSETKSEQQQEVKAVRQVDCDEFEKIIADKNRVVLIDVCSTEEFNAGHLKGAIHIDMRQNTFRKKCEEQFDKSKTIALYCRNGFRSSTAARILSEAGYDAVNLKGGINGWKEAGKEIVK